jgi:hypothetical protein
MQVASTILRVRAVRVIVGAVVVMGVTDSMDPHFHRVLPTTTKTTTTTIITPITATATVPVYSAERGEIVFLLSLPERRETAIFSGPRGARVLPNTTVLLTVENSYNP